MRNWKWDRALTTGSPQDWNPCETWQNEMCIRDSIVAEKLARASLINQQKSRMAEALHAVQVQEIADLAVWNFRFTSFLTLRGAGERCHALRRHVNKKFIYGKERNEQKKNEKENK